MWPVPWAVARDETAEGRPDLAGAALVAHTAAGTGLPRRRLQGGGRGDRDALRVPVRARARRMMTRDMRSMQLQAERVEIIRYLRVKVDVQDWHGVCDAANDLREI